MLNTAKSLKLEHIVSQRDFPILFSNNYTRVGDTIVTAIVFLFSEGNMSFIRLNRIKNTLKYWLFLWQSVRNDCLKNHRQDWWSPWTIREERLFRFTAAISWDQYAKMASRLRMIGIDSLDWRLHSMMNVKLKTSLIPSQPNSRRKKPDWFMAWRLHPMTKVISRTNLFPLPAELQTEAARQILDKAILLRLCDNEYHWQKTNSLLAYFADCACEHLKLSKAEQDGKKKTYWKPFETLFGVSGLANYKNTYTNKTGKLPIDHEIVESIFR